MSDPREQLTSFKPEQSFFVGIDSDGCVFDSMEIKHKECFIPNTIKHWGLQCVSKYAREAAEFVNLYSKDRGINRWPALTKVFDLLRQGATASEIIEFVSDDSYDADVGIRQYGVVTLNEGIIQVAGFTGKENNDWAGDQQDSTVAASVQGNTLEDAAVVSNALVAYTEEEIGAVELPDRLLRALEAASAAGGDRRCNQADVQQTAQAAFIAVAKADQLPFAATIGRDPAPGDPALPWLYISVIEPKGGPPNPLLELRSHYNTWRSENLPPCADCDLDPIPVPTGGDPKPLPKAILQIVSRVGLVGVGVGCLIGFALLVSLPVIIYFRRRKRRSSA